MKWYSDEKNVIMFPDIDPVEQDCFEIKREWEILRWFADTCYRYRYDPFLVIPAFCMSDVAKWICARSHIGYYYGKERFLVDLENVCFLPTTAAVWDLTVMHWVVDVYITAREKLGLTYEEIARRYPTQEVYNCFSPLHETSELNALTKMKLDPVDLCGCVINDRYYLYEHEIPKDLQYLLLQRDKAKYRKGLIFLDTVFFHLPSEEDGYLSNWYLAPFELDGHEFCCVEQYMMWAKATMFDDKRAAEQILATTDPAEMKRLGREVREYVDSKWSAVRYSVVEKAVSAKFEQNEDLRNRLLNTSGRFAECAVSDLVWGIGLNMNDPKRFDQCEWVGRNLLGVALGAVYDKLKCKFKV